MKPFISPGAVRWRPRPADFNGYSRPFRWRKAVKTRLLQAVFFITSVYGVIAFPNVYTLIGICMYALLETFAGNIGLHRYFGHRSFEMKPPLKPLFRFLCHYIGVGSVISWTGQHRWHHLYSDTVRDVHSPYYQGIFKIIFGTWNLKVERKMIADVIQDKNLVFWHKKYFQFHFLASSILLSADFILKTKLFYSLYALPCFMCLISGYVLAVLAHCHGYQTYSTKDQSRNSWIVNIYTLGEGWHNNHHAHPERLQQGELWWEWDLPAWIARRFLSTGIFK